MNIAFRIILAAVLLVDAICAPSAQGTENLPTIGLAVPVDPATDAALNKAFREGLRDLGYIDGENVRLIVRYSNGDPEKYRALIQELIAMRVDVLFGEAKEVKEATSTIPIVSPTMWDPVSSGLVASLARPGGNLTGVSYQGYEAALKLLELTKELLPGLRRICVVFDPDRDPAVTKYIDGEYRSRARELGMSVCKLPVRTLDDTRSVQRRLDKERPQAVVQWSSPFLYQHRHTVIPSMARRVPVVGDVRDLAELGAVLTYSIDWLEVFRRTATYVDRILKGANPGDLPIEQPTKFNLVVNLKAAKSLGIRVPNPIMVRANEILQ